MGSRGDINPFAGIAQRLQQRGHDVLFIAPGYYEPMIRSLGLQFVPMCSTQMFLDFSKEFQAARGLKSLDVGLRKGVFPLLRPVYRAITENIVPGKTVMVAQSISIGARVAHEKPGLPMISVHLSPLHMRDLEGSWFHRAMLASVDHGYLDPRLAPEINAFRRELGLQPVKRILHRWVNSTQLVIGMFPDWYSPPRTGWPAHFHLAGFPLFDGPETFDTMPVELDGFLRAGDRPVVVTAASTLPNYEAYYRTAAEALIRLGRRGILLSSFPEKLGLDWPTGILPSGYVSLKKLLPRSAGIISHGGMGTMAQALSAGVPHLIVSPGGVDPPINGRKVTEWGVGGLLRLSSFKPGRIVRKLRPLLDNPAVAANCKEYAARINARDAIQDACGLIEGLVF